MRFLFVTPVEAGTGETLTALRMAQYIVDTGDEVCFLASPFGKKFIEHGFPGKVELLEHDTGHKIDTWRSILKRFQPHLIVFADYPLMFFTSGTATFVDEDTHLDILSETDAVLVTLDHTGFAQQGTGVFFGAPHLSFNYQHWPDTPEFMRILLPCPMNEPGILKDRKGEPFRYWDVPLSISKKRRQEIRSRYLSRDDDFLIFHSVPNWAWRHAKDFQLPFYQYFAEILDFHLSGLSKPVTIVSVNNGQLLVPSKDSKNRYINSPLLSSHEYQELLLASDLMITENGISISMGMAICGLVPCVSFRNSYHYRALRRQLTGKLREIVVAMEMLTMGSVFAWDIFPAGGKDVIEVLGLYRDNSIRDGMEVLEIFDEQETPLRLKSLLEDSSVRGRIKKQQQAYIEKMHRIPDAGRVLHQLCDNGGRI